MNTQTWPNLRPEAFPFPPSPPPLLPRFLGTFHAFDTTASLYSMAREALHDESLPFELVTHPDRKPIPDSAEETLKTARLVPTAVVNFVCPAKPDAPLKQAVQQAVTPFF